MTVLEEFECPNCGANVDRPKPGQTIKCPYCEAVLSEPERPEKVIVHEVVREVVHERVVERVEPEKPAPDFHRSPNSGTGPVRVAFGVLVVLLLIVGAIVMTNEPDAAEAQAGSQARDDCESACRKQCKERYKSALEPQYDAGLPDDPGKAINEEMNAQIDEAACEGNCGSKCK